MQTEKHVLRSKCGNRTPHSGHPMLWGLAVCDPGLAFPRGAVHWPVPAAEAGEVCGYPGCDETSKTAPIHSPPILDQWY